MKRCVCNVVCSFVLQILFVLHLALLHIIFVQLQKILQFVELQNSGESVERDLNVLLMLTHKRMPKAILGRQTSQLSLLASVH